MSTDLDSDGVVDPALGLSSEDLYLYVGIGAGAVVVILVIVVVVVLTQKRKSHAIQPTDEKPRDFKDNDLLVAIRTANATPPSDAQAAERLHDTLTEFSMLEKAVTSGDVAGAINQLLTGCCAKATSRGLLNKLFLSVARTGQFDFLQMLWAAGADVNAVTDRAGNTVLHYISLAEKVDMIRFLLTKGALVVGNHRGEPPKIPPTVFEGGAFAAVEETMLLLQAGGSDGFRVVRDPHGYCAMQGTCAVMGLQETDVFAFNTSIQQALLDLLSTAKTGTKVPDTIVSVQKVEYDGEDTPYILQWRLRFKHTSEETNGLVEKLVAESLTPGETSFEFMKSVLGCATAQGHLQLASRQFCLVDLVDMGTESGVAADLRQLTQSMLAAKYFSGSLMLTALTVDQLRANPAYKDCLVQSVKHILVKAKVAPSNVQVALRLPFIQPNSPGVSMLAAAAAAEASANVDLEAGEGGDAAAAAVAAAAAAAVGAAGADAATPSAATNSSSGGGSGSGIANSNTVYWTCVVSNANKVDFSKIRSVLSSTSSWREMTATLQATGALCQPPIHEMAAIVDITLTATATEKTHIGSKLTVSNVTARTWRQHAEAIRQIAHDGFNRLARDSLGTNEAVTALQKQAGADRKDGMVALHVLATSVNFRVEQDRGVMEVEWSWDDSVASQAGDDCVSALLKLKHDLSNAEMCGQLVGDMFRDSARNARLPRDSRFTRSEFIPQAEAAGDADVLDNFLAMAGVKRDWVLINQAVDTSILSGLAAVDVQDAVKDVVAGEFWMHGFNLPRALITASLHVDGKVFFKVRVPDNSMTRAARKQLLHLAREAPSTFVAKIKASLAAMYVAKQRAAQDADDKVADRKGSDAEAAIVAAQTRLAVPHEKVAAVLPDATAEVYGRLVLSGIRSKAIVEHVDALAWTLSSLCFEQGVNAHFTVRLDRTAKEKGIVKLKYAAFTSNGFDGTQVHHVLDQVSQAIAATSTPAGTPSKNSDRKQSSSNSSPPRPQKSKTAKRDPAFELIDSFKKRLERNGGAEGLLSLQQMTLMKLEALTTAQWLELEADDKARAAKAAAQAQAEAGEKKELGDRRTTTETVATVETGKSPSKKARKLKKRQSRPESDGKSVVLTGMFVLSGVDNDEISDVVKVHIVKALHVMLDGMRPTIESDSLTIRPVTSLPSGHQLVSFELKLRGIDSPDTPAVEECKLRLTNGLHRGSGRVFIARLKRSLADAREAALKFNADLAVESVGAVEVLPSASQAAAKLSPMMKNLQKTKSMEVHTLHRAVADGSVTFAKLAKEDVRTMRKALKGVLVDLAYDLGIQTAVDSVTVTSDKPEPKKKKRAKSGDSTKLAFHFSLPADEMAAENMAQELDDEMRALLKDEAALLSALRRKTMELGAEPWSSETLDFQDASVADLMIVDENGVPQRLSDSIAAAMSKTAEQGAMVIALSQARDDNDNLFSTIRGSAALRDTTAAKFHDSASMYKGFKDSVLSVLVKQGLDAQSCRVKVITVTDGSASTTPKNEAEEKHTEENDFDAMPEHEVHVTYRVRIRARSPGSPRHTNEKDFGKKVAAARTALEAAFTEGSSEMAETIHKAAKKMESRIKRRQSRRVSSAPPSRHHGTIDSAARNNPSADNSAQQREEANDEDTNSTEFIFDD